MNIRNIYLCKGMIKHIVVQQKIWQFEEVTFGSQKKLYFQCHGSCQIFPILGVPAFKMIRNTFLNHLKVTLSLTWYWKRVVDLKCKILSFWSCNFLDWKWPGMMVRIEIRWIIFQNKHVSLLSTLYIPLYASRYFTNTHIWIHTYIPDIIT